MGHNREYLRTHPWINFKLDTRPLGHETWMALGEIVSKAQHVEHAPLQPETSQHLYRVFLAKGAAATTAIEGNTLSEDQVQQQLDGTLELPPSQAYLKQEVQNIVEACNHLVKLVKEDGSKRFEVAFINELNSKALKGLELEGGCVAGDIRGHSVVVAGYRGAPSEDCHFLLETLCNHLEEMLQGIESGKMYRAVLAALFAHVYIALIHPYGDGNGRTSRLLEVFILLRAGFPMPTCQLLSNHYNKTRSAYYRQLDAVSKSGGDLVPFVEYAIQGFVDGLREQVEMIQTEQMRVTWVNFVHNKFADQTTRSSKRKRDLALAISDNNWDRTIDEILASAPSLARDYAELGQRTLSRDIAALIDEELVYRASDKKLRPNQRAIKGFLPWRNKLGG